MTSVVVITPTTGHTKVLNAIFSVASQTYDDIKHLIVVDGQESIDRWEFIDGDKGSRLNYPHIEIVKLKTNTGANGFYGHRIYAGFAHLVNEDIVCFLDQDNTYDPFHVEELVKIIETKKLQMVYSLRNIHDKDGKFLCRDDCESLGKWPVWNSLGGDHFHLDTSAYGFRRDFLIQVANLWHGGYAQDRKFFNTIKQYFPDQFDTTGKYTLNYYLDGNPNSASPEFFLRGNEVMKQKYPDEKYPWRKND